MPERLGRNDRPAADFADGQGAEFIGRTLDAWAYAHGVTLRVSRPGKPIENAYVERVNGKFRDGCLDEHWLLSVVNRRQ